MFVLGITGGIGSGKSTVASIVAEAGLPLLDADVIAKTIMKEDTSLHDELKERFGPAILDEAGNIDKLKLSDLVFSDRRKLDQLDLSVHGRVTDVMVEELDKMSRDKKIRAAVIDVPIPVKRGFLDVSDLVWVVHCDREKRLKRLMRRGLTEAEARRRMAVQMTDEEYAACGDDMIDNNGTLLELYEVVREKLKDALESRGIPTSDLTR